MVSLCNSVWRHCCQGYGFCCHCAASDGDWCMSYYTLQSCVLQTSCLLLQWTGGCHWLIAMVTHETASSCRSSGSWKERNSISGMCTLSWTSGRVVHLAQFDKTKYWLKISIWEVVVVAYFLCKQVRNCCNPRDELVWNIIFTEGTKGRLESWLNDLFFSVYYSVKIHVSKSEGRVKLNEDFL